MYVQHTFFNSIYSSIFNSYYMISGLFLLNLLAFLFYCLCPWLARSDKNVYAKQNGGRFPFVIEPGTHKGLPLSLVSMFTNFEN